MKRISIIGVSVAMIYRIMFIIAIVLFMASFSALGSDFILEVTTTGAAETVVIPGTGTGYSYDIDWDDGDVDYSQTTNSPSHEYADAGTYEVAISGTFPRVYYNNGAYKTQPTGIVQWGDENTWNGDQTGMFYGCSNLIGSIPSDTSGPFASLTNGSYMFYNTSISGTLPSGMTLASLTIGNFMFRDTSISGTLPSGMTLASLTSGSSMFYNTSISGALPSGMTLASLTNGTFMFHGTSISGTLPSGMTLASLTSGSYMFYNTSISGALPSGMTLASLTNGTYMFYNTSISGALPSGMTLAALTNGSYMFYSTSISGALPSVMTLAVLTDGTFMFRDTSISGALPSGMTLASLTSGSSMFYNTSIGEVFYSHLLEAMEASNSNSGVAFHGGTAKYWSGDAATARAALIADHSWTFTDGGEQTDTTWTGGDYTMTGDFDISGDAAMVWPKSTGTITFSGTAAQDIDFDGETIEDIEIDKTSGTVTLSGDMDPDSITVTDGTLDIDGNDMSVAGNFTQADDTTVQDTTGGGTITIGGNLDGNGTGSNGIVWNGPDLDITGTADMDYCTATNSDASAGTQVDCTTSCTDGTGNTNWDFGGGGPISAPAQVIIIGQESANDDQYLMRCAL